MDAPGKTYSAGERFRIGASLLAPMAVLWLLSRKGWIPIQPRGCVVAALAAVIVGAIWPRPFSGWHRGLTKVQSWIGRRLVMLLLAIVFVLVVAPLGLLLRMLGKSFLDLGRADSYWKKYRVRGSLKDQF